MYLCKPRSYTSFAEEPLSVHMQGLRNYPFKYSSMISNSSTSIAGAALHGQINDIVLGLSFKKLQPQM